MSVRLARKPATKSNQKLVNQNYATLLLSWMPFSRILTDFQLLSIDSQLIFSRFSGAFLLADSSLFYLSTPLIKGFFIG